MKEATKVVYASSYKYILYAQNTNQDNGNENLGFLSFERGFMPLKNPIQNLPSPFSIWDQLATNIPFHYKNQSLRKAIKAMVVLDPNETALPDKYLCRASMLMSMLAHAYVRNERVEDSNVPESIVKPWKTITRRLKRPQPFLSYIDLILYNWKLKEIQKPFEVENLDLMVPTVNNQEERVFYLTQAEISYKTRSSVFIIATIQNAIVQKNVTGVIKGLYELKEIIHLITEDSFLKINPNPRSKTHVDPIVWAKTVAPFAVPLKEGVQGPSGTSAPFFHLMDTFIERNKYDTILGKESLFIREWYPEHWRNFLNEIEKVSIIDFITEVDVEELHGAFYSLIESYSGDQGFLGVHKRKVYGYLQMAFKVGRSVTIGGFSGLFKERTWEDVDDELEATRLERYNDKELKCPFSSVMSKKTIGENSVKNIRLDVTKKGVTYRPGDRCAIVPKNSKETVQELIDLMEIKGDDQITLNPVWINYFEKYYNYKISEITVTELLLSAKLGNLQNILEKCSHVSRLLPAKDKNTKVSLRDLIMVCKEHNLPMSAFIIPNLTTFLLPEKERMYSISSGFNNQNIELTVGNAETKIANTIYKGVASEYLHTAETKENTTFPFKIVRPLRFSLPKDLNVPILLFAGGTGIAPFKGFWEALRAEKLTSNLSLFYSIKHIEDIVFKEELEHLLLNEGANINIVATRDNLVLDKEKSIEKRGFIFAKKDTSRIETLLENTNNSDIIKSALWSTTGKAGYFYVCGKAGFAKAVLEQIKLNIEDFSIKKQKNPKEILYSLFAENRYMQDLFTTPENKKENPIKSYFMSEIIKHNNAKNGYWTVVNDKIYDLTEFKEIHPGGVKIIVDNAGRDGTHEFKRAKHQQSGEIMSMLSMYHIGDLKPIIIIDPLLKEEYQKWLEALHLSSEMHNTLLADYSFKNKKTTALESSDEITNYKIALLIENHKRFIDEYIKNILYVLKEFYQENKYYSKTLQIIDELVYQEIDFDLMNFQNNTITFDEIWNKLGIIEKIDLNIMKEYQKLLWAGLKFFENYEIELDTIFRYSLKNVLEAFKDSLLAIKQKPYDIILDSVLEMLPIEQ